MIHRRTLLLAGLSPLIARPALAQSGWPDRAIRIVVPFAAGSFTDIAARLLATELTEQLGQPVVVENRGGAGSTAGTQAVARAEPDGYTLVLSDISLSISPAIYPKLPYDPLRDLSFISRIADSPALLIVRPGLGVRTLAELIALGKQQAGRTDLRLGRPGLVGAHGDGAVSRHGRDQGAARAVPRHRGGDQRNGRRPCRHGDRQPRLRPRAGAGRDTARPRITGAARNPLLPDVPTFADAGLPKFNVPYWFALAAPAGTPAPVIERLNREVVRACAQPRLRDAFARQAAVAVTSTPAEMTEHLAREIAVWRDIVTRANISIQ